MRFGRQGSNLNLGVCMTAPGKDVSATYSGRGWNLVSWNGLRDAPGWFAAPVITGGALIVASLTGWLLVRGYIALATGSADDVYKILLTLAGAIGAPFIAWRTLVAYQQTVIARETHFTTLFMRAVEQLGATREAKSPQDRRSHTEANLEVRLGAIYALERIAQDSERDHWPIMEVLCSYVRNGQNTGTPQAKPEPISSADWRRMIFELPGARADIQAALTVFGRRGSARVSHEMGRRYVPDFSGANLQKCEIRGEFGSANFLGVNFAGARIRECLLADQALAGIVSLDGASLYQLNLPSLGFWRMPSIVGTNFFSCKMREASFVGMTLNEVFFTDSDLTGGSFRNSRMEDCRLSEANLAGADFDGAKLINTVLGHKIHGATFFGADLSEIGATFLLDLSTSIGDATTVLPVNVQRPDFWPDRKLNFLERHELAKIRQLMQQ